MAHGLDARDDVDIATNHTPFIPEAEASMQRAFVFIITNPFDLFGLPLPIKYAVRNTDFKTNILFLLAYVVPNLFGQGAGIDTLRYAMYQWVIDAALHEKTGVSNVLRLIVEQHSDVPWLHAELPLEEMEAFRPCGMNDHAVRELQSRIRRLSPATSSEVAIEPIGPRNGPRSISDAMEKLPVGQLCTIWLTGFEEEDECEELCACAHHLHMGCLDNLINRAYPRAAFVPCPNCRASLCKTHDFKAVR